VPIVSRRGRIWPALLLIALGATACTEEQTPPASGDPAGKSLVIAIAEEPASLNPLAGYAENGAAKIFDGLVEHRANGTLRPALAAELPKPSSDGRSWTVRLRTGVTFSDGTAFDAADVVATFRALLDPAYASPVRQRFEMLTGVAQVDSLNVRFELARPYAPFPQLLVLGILPAEALARAEPVTASPPPLGTGPYKLADWQRGQQMVLEANKTYFDGPPEITRVTVEFVGDDDVRAQRMRDGKVDSAALPPTLARMFDGASGLRVVAHSSADLQTVLLPAGNPVTADPAIRLALNYGVNRKALVDGLLAGKGIEASTPVPDLLEEYVEPTARYSYDVTRALDLLAEAGWQPGPDGIRAKDGVPATFTLLYRGGDTLARDLAGAFAAAARGIGIQVNPEASGASALTSRAGKDAVLHGVGNAFDPDFSLYTLLHAGLSPSGYTNPIVDAALETGHTATDPAQRATAYRKLQRAYLSAPGMVELVAPQHIYVLRENWNGYQPVADGDSADATWGAWWNLGKWTPR
jgi:peptide/nickel transport system substrate-binding protein